MIEHRASERHWPANVNWLDQAGDFWAALKTFRDPTSRVMYWGHAHDDLWLALGRSPRGTAVAPEDHEILRITDIDPSLRDHFLKGSPHRLHRFVGCNTASFAAAWATAYDVWASGVTDKVNFSAIHTSGGEPKLVDDARWRGFEPGGAERSVPSESEVDEAAGVPQHPLFSRIFELVTDSSVSTYHWKDRGVAPIGYLKGMALTYARVYCKYALTPGDPENFRDRFAVKMAKGIRRGFNSNTDAVSRYEARFMEYGADVSFDGVHVIRALFTILFGLGMRESNGKHCAGWDHGEVNGWGNPSKAVVPTDANAEAGLFQISYDIGMNVGDFRDLYNMYRQRPDSGFLDVFSEGVTCGRAEGADFGTAGDALDFRRFSKDCPAFTAELAALALRTRANHWGPINRNTLEIRRDVWSLLLEVEHAVDSLGTCLAVD